MGTHRLRGVTLIELLVTVTVIGLIFGVAGVGLGVLRAPEASPEERRLADARADAVLGAEPVRLTPDSVLDPRYDRPVLFLPDGRGLGPGVDAITGKVLRAAR